NSRRFTYRCLPCFRRKDSTPQLRQETAARLPSPCNWLGSLQSWPDGPGRLTAQLALKEDTMRDQKRKQVAIDTSAPTDTIGFHEAVIEGTGILKQIDAAERGKLRLGELVAKVEKKYGDRTLAKFAEELGIAKCTLDRYQTVYRAWEGKLAP